MTDLFSLPSFLQYLNTLSKFYAKNNYDITKRMEAIYTNHISHIFLIHHFILEIDIVETKQFFIQRAVSQLFPYD